MPQHRENITFFEVLNVINLQEPLSRTMADRSTQCTGAGGMLATPQHTQRSSAADSASSRAADSLLAAEKQKSSKLELSYEQKCRDLDEANAMLADHARSYAQLIAKVGYIGLS